MGDRDWAALLFLLDTGLRASEFCNLNVGDVDIASGAVLVRRGKGSKNRIVFFGTIARKELWKSAIEQFRRIFNGKVSAREQSLALQRVMNDLAEFEIVEKGHAEGVSNLVDVLIEADDKAAAAKKHKQRRNRPK